MIDYVALSNWMSRNWLIIILFTIILTKVFDYLIYVFYDKKKLKSKIEKGIDESDNFYSTGDYGRSLEKYNKTIELCNIKNFPELSGQINFGIGNCYLKLADVKNDESLLNAAINHFNEAKSIFSTKTKIMEKGEISKKLETPQKYAKTLNNLSKCYFKISNIRDKRENLENAISIIKRSLKIYTCINYSDEIYNVLENLGTYYRSLAEILDRNENTIKAIKTYEKVLKYYNKNDNPHEYSRTLFNLGTSYLFKARVSDKIKNLHIALDNFKKAEDVINPKDDANFYSVLKNNMGLVYTDIAKSENTEINCDYAIESFKKAIEFTPKDASYDKFQLDVNIGLVYQTLAICKNHKENLEIAIKIFEEQLSNIGRVEYPIDNAKLKRYLANAYGDIARFENKANKIENYKKSIQLCKDVLDVFNNENYPETYFHIISMLSSYYNNLALTMDNKSSIKQNIEESMKYSNEVISLTNPESNLFEYSEAHYNLGACHANLCLIEGVKNDNNYNEAKRCLELVLSLMKDNRLRIYENAKIHLEKLSNM